MHKDLKELEGHEEAAFVTFELFETFVIELGPSPSHGLRQSTYQQAANKIDPSPLNPL